MNFVTWYKSISVIRKSYRNICMLDEMSCKQLWISLRKHSCYQEVISKHYACWMKCRATSQRQLFLDCHVQTCWTKCLVQRLRVLRQLTGKLPHWTVGYNPHFMRLLGSYRKFILILFHLTRSFDHVSSSDKLFQCSLWAQSAYVMAVH